MRRALGAGLVTACLMGAVACSGDVPDAVPSPSASSTSPTATATASPSPTAVAPTLPPEAMERTAVGAEAFARFYFDTLNHAVVTGDVAALDRLSREECQACIHNRGFALEPYETGGHWDGAQLRLLSMAAPPPTDGGATVTLRLEQESGIRKHGDGSTELMEAVPPFSANMYLVWDGLWRVAELTNVSS